MSRAVISPGSKSNRGSIVVPGAENVRVIVRIRPLNSPELEESHETGIWSTSSTNANNESKEDADDNNNDGFGHISLLPEFRERLKKGSSSNSASTSSFKFDQVYTGSDNLTLYNDSIGEYIQAAMEGYNTTVFAYGQTSSGKTFTMTGSDSQPGIIPQAVKQVFNYISQSENSREFLLRVSYLEIYNETIRDLLNPEQRDLRIHQDTKKRVFVTPLKEEIVTSANQVFKVIQKGMVNRHTSETDYNQHSSRSHAIFQMIIESREKSSSSAHHKSPSLARSRSSSSFTNGGKNGGGEGGNMVKISCLNLIDLAGSEKASSDAERRMEGSFINKSLLTLGAVISKLTEEKYEGNKLTRILQSSLSGEARIAVICTISPGSLNYEESINTLKFAKTLKRVQTRAVKNQILDDKALLQKYRSEIDQLRSQLEATNAAYESEREAERSQILQERARIEEEMMEQHLLRTALKERIEHLTKLILTSSSVIPRASNAAANSTAKTPAAVNNLDSNNRSTLNIAESVVNLSEVAAAEQAVTQQNLLDLQRQLKELEDTLKLKEKFIEELQGVNKQLQEDLISCVAIDPQHQQYIKSNAAALKITSELADSPSSSIDSSSPLPNGDQTNNTEFQKITNLFKARFQEYDRRIAERDETIKELHKRIQLLTERINTSGQRDATGMMLLSGIPAKSGGEIAFLPNPEDLASTGLMKKEDSADGDSNNALKQQLLAERALRQMIEKSYTEKITALESEMHLLRNDLTICRLKQATGSSLPNAEEWQKLSNSISASANNEQRSEIKKATESKTELPSPIEGMGNILDETIPSQLLSPEDKK